MKLRMQFQGHPAELAQLLRSILPQNFSLPVLTTCKLRVGPVVVKGPTRIDLSICSEQGTLVLDIEELVITRQPTA
jgi:hypothetical protein